MDLWKIILIIILIIIIIVGIVNIYFKTDVLYDSILNCNIDSEDLSDEIEKTSSANLAFSMWYFINDFTSGSEIKPFLTYYTNKTSYVQNKMRAIVKDYFNDNYSSTSITKKIDLATAAAASEVSSANVNANDVPTIFVYLNEYRNDIHILVRTSDNDSKIILSRFVLKNIPLQKWVNLTFTIDNNVFDIYLDGKLHNSFILPDALYTVTNNIDSNSLYLNGDGSEKHKTFLTRLRYINRAITTTEAYDLYKDGINSSHATSLFNKYNLKVSFLEYNQEKSSFMI
tara:strand:+ start:7354 stop:8208 length:855 start_codon:yes stop_codon:yes gene_type:complete